MVYADELVAPTSSAASAGWTASRWTSGRRPWPARLIAALEADFEPGRYTDSYREALLELIERKASGATDVTVAAPAPTSDTVVDLMAALEASVAAAKEARKRHPAAAGGSAAAGGVSRCQRNVRACGRAGAPVGLSPSRPRPRRAGSSSERIRARAGDRGRPASYR